MLKMKYVLFHLKQLLTFLVCSKQPLNKIQFLKFKKAAKNVLKNGWYITEYDSKVHRATVAMNKIIFKQ